MNKYNYGNLQLEPIISNCLLLFGYRFEKIDFPQTYSVQNRPLKRIKISKQ